MTQPRHRLATPLFVLTVGLGLMILIAIANRVVFHPLIRMAYANPDLPVLGSALAGRDLHDVNLYLGASDAAARKFSVMVALLATGFAVLSVPRIRERIDQLVDVDSAAAPIPVRFWSRTGLLLGITAAFATLQAIAIVTQKELWPFSPYAMYAAPQGNPFSSLHVELVTDSGQLPIDPARDVPPFDIARLPNALEQVVATQDMAVIRQALASVGAIYQRAQRRRATGAPPLTAVRLYRVEWTIDPLLQNIDHPDKRTLLAEYVTGR